MHLELGIDSLFNTTSLNFSDTIGVSRPNPLLGLEAVLLNNDISSCRYTPLGGL